VEHAEEVARSNADLARFASVVAHDLKSPLQVISGFAEMLGETHGDVLDERGREYVSYIVKNAARLNRLIDDLVSWARVGADRRPPEVVPLDRVLAEVRARLADDIAASGASVVSVALPEVTGDATQFVLLLHHLVANAITFVAAGTRPDVRLSASRMADAWCIEVADNGVGIEPEYRSQVFGIFQRLPRPGEGTGIGLALCQRIVELRGGAIWVEENAGGGSRFRFTVPDDLGSPA